VTNEEPETTEQQYWGNAIEPLIIKRFSEENSLDITFLILFITLFTLSSLLISMAGLNQSAPLSRQNALTPSSDENGIPISVMEFQ